MYCNNCDKEINTKARFCKNCGEDTTNTKNLSNVIYPKPPKQPWSIGRIIKIVVIVLVVGFLVVFKFGVIAINSIENDAINSNDKGLSSLESGDSIQAINQFEKAADDAVLNSNKLSILINLGYAYSSEEQNNQALNSFKEALDYAPKNSSDYYLISGEIALLEGKPNAAQLSLNKAYEISPNDFQVNSSLTLFHLDLEDIAPYYVDYPKALTHAQKAYNNDPEKSEITKQNLAIAHFFNENYDKTISLLSTTNLSQHPYIAYWLGWAYIAKEDIPTAKIYFKKAVDAGVEGMEQEVYDYLNLY